MRVFLPKSFIGYEEPLSAQENEQLLRQYKDETDEVRKKELLDKLVLGNIRLVIYFLSKYYPDVSVDIEDIVLEGVIGLVRAIEKYDPDRGIRFATYAYYWVKKMMNRYLTNAATMVRYPNKITETLIQKRVYEVGMEKLKEMYPQYANIPDNLIRDYVNHETIFTSKEVRLEFVSRRPGGYEEEYILLYNLLRSRINEISSDDIIKLGLNQRFDEAYDDNEIDLDIVLRKEDG